MEVTTVLSCTENNNNSVSDKDVKTAPLEERIDFKRWYLDSSNGWVMRAKGVSHMERCPLVPVTVYCNAKFGDPFSLRNYKLTLSDNDKLNGGWEPYSARHCKTVDVEHASGSRTKSYGCWARKEANPSNCLRTGVCNCGCDYTCPCRWPLPTVAPKTSVSANVSSPVVFALDSRGQPVLHTPGLPSSQGNIIPVKGTYASVGQPHATVTSPPEGHDVKLARLTASGMGLD